MTNEEAIEVLKCCMTDDCDNCQMEAENVYRCAESSFAPAFVEVPTEMLLQVLKMAQAQQPRVLTEEDFIDNPLVDENGNVPAWCEHRVFNGVVHDADGWTTINQMWVCGLRTQRYWTARPTNEQRRAVKWDD